ncbi:hypothetical protein C5167_014183 [Papaver somniferum]|uniref:Uncharacterized protein n=1 Tax=Papaver somniferum TaxID=3469 RepID=A0A4Y7J2G1_PAPSO|nr:hypothetical protein C5167_014183 [Papaver somniferum]
MSEKHGEESKPICRRYQYQSGPVKVELRLSNCSGTDSESTNKQTNGGMEALIVVQSPKCVFQTSKWKDVEVVASGCSLSHSASCERKSILKDKRASRENNCEQ